MAREGEGGMDVADAVHGVKSDDHVCTGTSSKCGVMVHYPVHGLHHYHLHILCTISQRVYRILMIINIHSFYDFFFFRIVY